MTSSRRALILSLVVLLLAATPQFARAEAPDKIKLTFSTYFPLSYEYGIRPIQSFIDKVEERSGGRVEFEFFHSAQLFGGKEEFGALARGDIDMAAPVDIYHTGKIPALGITNLPFLWPSPASLQKTLDAGLWDLGIREALRAQNIVVLNVAVCGPNQIYSGEFPVRGPEDFAGRKWAASGTTAAKAIELLGGAPTTMTSGELYLALQRGTVDGTTRPLMTGIGRKLYEVNKYLTIVNLNYCTIMLAINKDRWHALPDDIRTIMKAAADERSREQLALVEAYRGRAIAEFEAKGVKIHIADAAALAVFKEKMAPVYDWWKAKVEGGEDLIEFSRQNQ
jgi:TRAP-type C4-dicarboxylate transport system substrate-binding protein